MTVDEFVKCPYSRLEDFTGISKVVWSYYFNDKRGMSEKTVRQVASKLNMPISDLLDGLQRRREGNLSCASNKLTN